MYARKIYIHSYLLYVFIDEVRCEFDLRSSSNLFINFFSFICSSSKAAFFLLLLSLAAKALRCNRTFSSSVACFIKGTDLIRRNEDDVKGFDPEHAKRPVKGVNRDR